MPYEPEEEPFDLTCGYYKHIHKFTSAPANQAFSCPICGATLLVTAQIGIIPFVIDRDLCNCDQIDLQSFTALHQLADEHRNMLVEHLGSVNDDEQVEISVELNCPLFIITAWDKTALLTSEEMAKIIHLEQDKKDWLLRENGLLRDSGLNLHTSPGLQENETLITRQVFRQFLLHQIERGGSPQTIGVYELPSNADIKWKIFVYDEDRFDLFGVVKQDERNQQGPHFLLYAQEDEVPFPLVIIEAGKEPSIIHMCLTPFHMETNLKAREIYIKPMFLKRMMTMALFALAHRMDSESIINDIDEDDANETNNVPVDSTALGAMLIRMEQNRDSGNTPPSMLHPQWN